MLNQFIERPVLSTVISIVILILGVLGIYTLPVTQYPDIAPPTVQVTASYPGANAETILESVISPLEEQINGVEGMIYMSSTASNNGSADIQVFFEQGYDADIAAVNVQNRVARANGVLPSDVTRSGVITQKRQNSALMYAGLFSNSDQYDDTYLQNYLKINIVPELQRIKGVGEVNVFGGMDYTMRIWLDPVKMASYGLSPVDISAAIQEQSREAAPGALGQNSGESFEYVIKYPGRYKDEKSYEDIVVRALEDGSLLRLKDVAEIELGAFTYSSFSRSKGNPAISFGVFQTPGSNAQEINDEVLKRLDELKEDFPEGIDYLINYNTSTFLEASIEKVVETLLEAFLLVFFVVFIFLQDFRSTLIPAIAVPVSIIGTFFFLNLFGFSINLLTLFALILAIGIVVDDAIVVVEAVHAKLEGGETDSLKASKDAMSEISAAIVSITLVMAAVFIPITFIQGPSGVFYKQFGLTLIVAIFISAVNALTLSPALCAVFLRNHHTKEKKGVLNRFYAAFNAGFKATTDRYAKGVGFLLRFKFLTVIIIAAAIAGILWTNEVTPAGFVPSEDRGVVFLNMELPAGSSMDRTFAAADQLYEEIKDIPGIKTATTISGRNFFSGAGSSYGMGFILLDDWKMRDTPEKSLSSIMGALYQKAALVHDASVIFFTPPSIPGFGSSDGFELKILDKAAGPLEDLNQVANDFVGALFQRPEIGFASNSFSTGFPQYQLDIDIPKAKRSGVDISSILSTLQGYFGGLYTTDFSKFGKPYRVYIQTTPEHRSNEESLDKIYVKNGSGEMAPISSFVSLEKIYGPQTVNRFNLFNAVSINGAAAGGFSSGDAIQAIEEVAATALPTNYEIAFSGITREEINSAGQAPFIVGLSILFVFFFLAAQYESYILPFAVLFSLPIGIAGAFISTNLAGHENNIYFQVAMVMLLGLLAKNAILIVEFALQRRHAGLSLHEAAIEGARVRFRPILMTSFAFVLGLLPLVFAKGVGAVGNNSIGTGAAGGMLVGTVVGLFVIPVLFVVFQWLHEKVSSKKSI